MSVILASIVKIRLCYHIYDIWAPHTILLSGCTDVLQQLYIVMHPFLSGNDTSSDLTHYVSVLLVLGLYTNLCIPNWDSCAFAKVI